jgi:membrane-bound ClpP family serine protease
MLTYILTILIVGYIFFELAEHVVFPLVWGFAGRNRQSRCGKDGMLGKTVEVRFWEGAEGRVVVEGELWKAASNEHLQPGDRAVVQQVDGLVLKIASSKRDAELPA